MIHIPQDKRAEESAWKIYQSVRHLLKKKNLSDITVTDVKEESGIARSTFYRLFDNVADPLEMQMEKYLNKYYETAEKKEDKILYFYEYFNRHSDLVFILSHQADAILKKLFLKRYNTNGTAEGEYLVSYKIGIITSLLGRWTERGKKESPPEMAEITRSLLSMNMTEILL